MSDQRLFQSDPKNKRPTPTTNPIAVGSGGVERSAGSIKAGEVVTSDSHEIELPGEVKEAGVEKIPNEGTIVEIPPDVKKMGVTQSGPAAPVTASSTSQVQIPIADDQLIKDSKGPVTSALTWLAIWCIRKLKKMRLALVIIHGKAEIVKE